MDVAAAIMPRGGTFLAALRPDCKPLGGYWEFPGGKANAHEPLEQALCRELEEELGILAKNPEFFRTLEHPAPKNGLLIRLHFFIVREWRNEPKAREGQQLAWLTPTEALKMDFLPADREIVAQLGQILTTGND